ncbi:family 43 glycosylhydrolase [Sphingobacterium bovistauri]|uniref:Family 43 glycosylhydrolase n=1 Tax=Sphingobacterium bovistauri TaxID=2781959 RepID=A0ABS7Z4Z8_9SPHI|nr:family 43 glycosylhydrolase [Sphingobacterium bovistauri]MCA5003824.1 family 43 glycosylhydrolase [Sphingobacterium bovistauri]
MKKHLFSAFFLLLTNVFTLSSQEHIKPKNLNPILPGYFADPTIKKIKDTYYIYATTDGNGGGLGPSQVWTSKDFMNWTIQPMNWPNTHWYWAPDMTQGYDGRYYLYYSQPVEIFGAVSESPIGPWHSLGKDGSSIIPNYLIPGVITLDAQTFKDDDGKIYMYWGTWGIYPDHGCAVGLLNEDMKSFEKVKLIPNTDVKDFFEAPYVFKRNNIYYFMYSSGHCEDHTYRVQYATSKVGPMGPFHYESNNPILETNADGTIHGPGHHSLIEENGRHFIVYHRHNNPHSGGGFHRQIAVDELFFDAEGKIKRIIGTHQGVEALVKKSVMHENIAFGKKVTASSFYSDDFKPSFLVDDNNGTLWRSKDINSTAWLTVDLDEVQNISTVALQFEYPTYAYQFTIETSIDGQNWELYVDQSKNNRWASPILNHRNTNARYVRVNVINTQHPGLPKGLWNIKIYQKRINQETLWSSPQIMPEVSNVVGELVKIDASEYSEGDKIDQISNKGLLDGNFRSLQKLSVKVYQGKKAFYFDGKTNFKSTFKVPTNISGNNPYTVSMWINNPEISRYEDVVSYSSGVQDLTRSVFGIGSDATRGAITHGAWPDLGFKEVPKANQWNHVVFTFDGYLEKIYVNGVLQKEQNRMLFVKANENFILGSSDLFINHFSGYLADLKVFNLALDVKFIEQEIQKFYNVQSYFSLRTEGIPLGEVSFIRNQGSIGSHFTKILNKKLETVGNRTAIGSTIIQDSILNEVLSSDEYCIALDLYENNNWDHYILNYHNDNFVLFKNGKRQKKPTLKGLKINKDNTLQLNASFHFLDAYPNTVSINSVADYYHRWRNTFSLELSSFIPKVISQPKLINDQNVFIHVESKLNNVKYVFVSENKSSGWVDEPYYLFTEAESSNNIIVQLKDEFGNVSLPYTFEVSKTPLKLLDGSTIKSGYTFNGNTIPFWDGIKLPYNLDSTKTNVSFDNDKWILKSTHTRWASDALFPPFMYKEIIGDFTFQIKIDDVPGLNTKTRTSSEAGIMIRNKDEINSYINNTVLTGWNLGNLWRSTGNRKHQEGNNGSGLNFHPYLQVQRFGNLFFLRSSIDGINWINLPNMPCKRDDLDGKLLQIGIYQIATNNQEGYGYFSNINLWH